VFSGNNRGSLPWYVNSLPICLMDNLMLKEDEVFFQRFRMCNKEVCKSEFNIFPGDFWLKGTERSSL